MELGPEDVSLLERCPYFRERASMSCTCMSVELGPEDTCIRVYRAASFHYIYALWTGTDVGSKFSLTSTLGSISPHCWSFQDKSLRRVRNCRTLVSGCGLITIVTCICCSDSKEAKTVSKQVDLLCNGWPILNLANATTCVRIELKSNIHLSQAPPSTI